jgi:hypothetical protein
MVDRTDGDVAARREHGDDDQEHGEAAGQCPPPPQPESSSPFDGLTWQEWSTGPMTTSPQDDSTAMTISKARCRIAAL